MTRRQQILIALTVGIIATVGAVPPPAGAATQIGQTFTPTGSACTVNQTLLQSGTPPPPAPQYTVPSAGVITSWSYQAAATSLPQLKFKVARPAGGNNFTILAEDGPRTPAASALNTYPVQIRVQPGDVIGVYVATSGLCARFLGGGSGFSFHVATGDPLPPTTASFSGPFFSSQLDVSAALEPDCDSDGLGDETQDPELTGPGCPPPAGPQPKADGTLTIGASKGRVEKGRRVTLSGRLDVPSNASCEPVRSVQVQAKGKSDPDSAFETFETVQTDNAGSYSLKVKLRRTRNFRAVVSETDACDDETSSTQKVRVKKKK